ncbi:MAG: multicopper oxidase domain-containing protein [Candidatus Sulfomarinibacteraceae bacterium]
MKQTSIKTLLGRSVLAAAVLALVAGSASAATYDLRAGTTSVDYGNGPVAAWGYALVSSDIGGGPVAGDNVVMVPGPTIYVPAGQDLTINLLNNLGESTSLVIQGQKLTGTPQINVGGRVTAFTDEAAAGAGTASYYWSAAELKAGTFLYNSGSHPAKQVHMGLYGAVVVDADPTGCASGLAAYPGVCYDRDIVIIYSEVDPDLRNTAAPAQPLNFKPKYFLVNGDATGGTVLTEATPAELNSRVLLRFVNAGIKGYVPTLLGEDLAWVAEYGNPYPHVRNSYSAYLSAGKTMDAIWVPETFDRHPLFDRRLHMSYNGRAMGGLKAFLDSANTILPVADAGTDQIHVPLSTAGVPTTIQLNGGPATGVTYEWALIGFPEGSAATLSDTTIANPTFVLDQPGTYTAQLVVNDGTYSSAPDSVSIFTNLPPVAVANVAASAEQGDLVALDGSDSYDPDATDTIATYDWVVTAPDSTQVASSGVTSSFTASQIGTYTVELTVSDGELSGSTISYVAVSQFWNSAGSGSGPGPPF